MIRKLFILLLFAPLFSLSQNTYQIAVLKYNGGGDWYSNPTALPNLVNFCNENINTNEIIEIYENINEEWENNIINEELNKIFKIYLI